jgi:small-conductance mechanosensitive channel
MRNAGFRAAILLRLRVTPTAFDQPDVRALAAHLEGTVITLVAAIITWRIKLALIDRFYARRFVSRYMPRVATFATLSKSVVGLLIIVAGFLELLNIWSVNVVPAVWSAGLVTAALAFGSQTVVRDIVTGFFFLFEDQYDVGDRVELITGGGQIVAGVVESMGLRTTKVVDRQGRFVVVPNGNIALVTNASRLPSTAAFTVAVPWKADALAMRDRFMSYVREIGASAGKPDAQFTVSLADTTPDGAVYRVELRSANAEADLDQLDLRERLVARLQADDWLPGVARSDRTNPPHEET